MEILSRVIPRHDLMPLIGAERNASAAKLRSFPTSIECFHGVPRRRASSSDVANFVPMSSQVHGDDLPQCCSPSPKGTQGLVPPFSIELLFFSVLVALKMPTSSGPLFGLLQFRDRDLQFCRGVDAVWTMSPSRKWSDWLHMQSGFGPGSPYGPLMHLVLSYLCGPQLSIPKYTALQMFAISTYSLWSTCFSTVSSLFSWLWSMASLFLISFLDPATASVREDTGGDSVHVFPPSRPSTTQRTL